MFFLDNNPVRDSWCDFIYQYIETTQLWDPNTTIAHFNFAVTLLLFHHENVFTVGVAAETQQRWWSNVQCFEYTKLLKFTLLHLHNDSHQRVPVISVWTTKASAWIAGYQTNVVRRSFPRAISSPRSRRANCVCAAQRELVTSFSSLNFISAFIQSGSEGRRQIIGQLQSVVWLSSLTN